MKAPELYLRQILSRLKAACWPDNIYSRQSMSHVLILFSETQGKYELKYKLSTLIYPFTKQRTSSLTGSPREIAWLLVPTHLWMAAMAYCTGELLLSPHSVHGSVLTQKHSLIHIHAAASKRWGSIPPLWGLLAVENGTRRSSDGSQAEVLIISLELRLRHEEKGLVHRAEIGKHGSAGRHQHHV